MGEGWRALRAHCKPLIPLSVGLTLLQLIPELITSRLHLPPLGASALDLVVNWVSTMVGLSILTTLYGHYIEGRPLR